MARGHISPLQPASSPSLPAFTSTHPRPAASVQICKINPFSNQYCKAIILQFKISVRKGRMRTGVHMPMHVTHKTTERERVMRTLPVLIRG